MRSLILLSLLVACDAEDTSTMLPPPGPQGITLTGPGSVVRGTDVAWEVRAPDLQVGDAVSLA
jgi:hypothetical protein